MIFSLFFNSPKIKKSFEHPNFNKSSMPVFFSPIVFKCFVPAFIKFDIYLVHNTLVKVSPPHGIISLPQSARNPPSVRTYRSNLFPIRVIFTLIHIMLYQSAFCRSSFSTCNVPIFHVLTCQPQVRFMFLMS